ncbi:transglutaminase domain-containing protein [Actinomycetota bacterium]
MKKQIKIIISLGAIMAIIGIMFLSLFLYSLPGLRLLPKEKITTIDGITTIGDAVKYFKSTELEGWEMVEAVQKFTAKKMPYSRRNPWDFPSRAFSRGMGYCYQYNIALHIIFKRLGIQSRPVQTFKAEFPPSQIHGMPCEGGITSHAWLEVTVDGETKNVCAGDINNSPGKNNFKIVGEVTGFNSFFQAFTWLGGILVNQYRDRRALKEFKGI